MRKGSRVRRLSGIVISALLFVVLLLLAAALFLSISLEVKRATVEGDAGSLPSAVLPAGPGSKTTSATKTTSPTGSQEMDDSSGFPPLPPSLPVEPRPFGLNEWNDQTPMGKLLKDGPQPQNGSVISSAAGYPAFRPWGGLGRENRRSDELKSAPVASQRWRFSKRHTHTWLRRAPHYINLLLSLPTFGAFKTSRDFSAIAGAAGSPFTRHIARAALRLSRAFVRYDFTMSQYSAARGVPDQDRNVSVRYAIHNYERIVPAYSTICGDNDCEFFSSHLSSLFCINALHPPIESRHGHAHSYCDSFRGGGGGVGRFILVLNSVKPEWVIAAKILAQMFPQRFVLETPMLWTRELLLARSVGVFPTGSDPQFSPFRHLSNSSDNAMLLYMLGSIPPPEHVQAESRLWGEPFWGLVAAAPWTHYFDDEVYFMYFRKDLHLLELLTATSTFDDLIMFKKFKVVPKGLRYWEVLSRAPYQEPWSDELVASLRTAEQDARYITFCARCTSATVSYFFANNSAATPKWIPPITPHLPVRGDKMPSLYIPFGCHFGSPRDEDIIFFPPGFPVLDRVKTSQDLWEHFNKGPDNNTHVYDWWWAHWRRHSKILLEKNQSHLFRAFPPVNCQEGLPQPTPFALPISNIVSVAMNWNRILNLCFRGLVAVDFVVVANGDFTLLDGEIFNYAHYVHSLKKDSAKRRNLIGYEDWLKFGFFIYTFEGWQDIGEFDETMFPGFFEDNEMHLRIQTRRLMHDLEPNTLHWTLHHDRDSDMQPSFDLAIDKFNEQFNRHKSGEGFGFLKNFEGTDLKEFLPLPPSLQLPGRTPTRLRRSHPQGGSKLGSLLKVFSASGDYVKAKYNTFELSHPNSPFPFGLQLTQKVKRGESEGVLHLSVRSAWAIDLRFRQCVLLTKGEHCRANNDEIKKLIGQKD